MCYERNCLATDAALLLARLGVGGMMLLHGIGKLTGGIVWLEQLLQLNGMPAFLAYGVYLGEIVAPLMLIVGFAVRPAAFILLVNMVFAVGLTHADDLWLLSPQGGWMLEVQGLYMLFAVMLMLSGGGRFSVPCPACRFFGKKTCKVEDAEEDD
ncbi:MAG: DoxX family protein [Opitutales bacterium]|nr:DoxX family protein [Opitutales bacterium]